MRKKLTILFALFVCLVTPIFAESLNGAPSLSCGIKFNNPSTKIQIFTFDGDQHNLIDWAGLESVPSFAIDFNYEWYCSCHPIYFGIGADLDMGDISSFDPSFKLGCYNNYINLFCKVGISKLVAKMEASKDVYLWNGGDYSKIESICFNGVGYNLGLGLDIHPGRRPLFIRLSYDYESYNPDLEIKTLSFTQKVKSSDIVGSSCFSNSSFTISVGWQFKRKNIVMYN